MTKASLLRTAALIGLAVVFGTTAVIAAPATSEEERKCDELLKKDASPDLFSEVLNCDLNVDEETFAAAGGFGVDSDLTRQLITGGDITLTSFNEEDPVTPPVDNCVPTCPEIIIQLP
jgi:hypothetical protein